MNLQATTPGTRMRQNPNGVTGKCKRTTDQVISLYMPSPAYENRNTVIHNLSRELKPWEDKGENVLCNLEKPSPPKNTTPYLLQEFIANRNKLELNLPSNEGLNGGIFRDRDVSKAEEGRNHGRSNEKWEARIARDRTPELIIIFDRMQERNRKEREIRSYQVFIFKIK